MESRCLLGSVCLDALRRLEAGPQKNRRGLAVSLESPTPSTESSIIKFHGTWFEEMIATIPPTEVQAERPANLRMGRQPSRTKRATNYDQKRKSPRYLFPSAFRSLV